MASIQKINGKNGISFRFSVSSGKDSSGKQIRHTTTWRPDPSMTPKQAEKEAKRQAFLFEQKIKFGLALDNRQTFSQYSRIILERMEANGNKQKTIASYRYLLQKINSEIGAMKLNEIRPQHLNNFYQKLAETPKATANKKIPVANITEILRSKGLTQKAVADASGLSIKTIEAICHRNTVNAESAVKFSSAIKADIEELFSNSPGEDHLSPKTILEYHRCIHSILSQAYREMLIEFNPADRVTLPKMQRKDVDCYQPTELQAIVTALENEPIKWSTLTKLLILTGCRRGEILGLSWSDIDLVHNKIYISKTLEYTPAQGIYVNPPKSGKSRTIDISNNTADMLQKYRIWYDDICAKMGDQWNETGYVFVRENGLPLHPDSVNKWLTKFAKRRDLPQIHPHKFRHTATSILIQKGLDVQTVASFTGHADKPTLLQTYAHQFDAANTMSIASKCLDDVLFPSQVVPDNDLPF